MGLGADAGSRRSTWRECVASGNAALEAAAALDPSRVAHADRANQAFASCFERSCAEATADCAALHVSAYCEMCKRRGQRLLSAASPAERGLGRVRSKAAPRSMNYICS